MKIFRSQVSWGVLAVSLTLMAAGCKSKQDAAIEQAREKAISIGQPQQVVTTDKNGYFDFLADRDSRFVHLSLPSGCQVPTLPTGAANLFHPIRPARRGEM